MKSPALFAMLPLSLALLSGCACPRSSVAPDATAPVSAWRQEVAERVPAFGHRNWIVVADAAYPSQGRSGIETLVTGDAQLNVLNAVLEELSRHRHVRPVVYLDAELDHVPETDAPGIERYRGDLAQALAGQAATRLPHEQIIERLDETGATFNVLILKTTQTLPYTSVFIELDCGYWSSDAEARLRRAMQDAAPK